MVSNSICKLNTKKWKRAFYTLQKLANFFTSITAKKKSADKSNFYLKILIKNYQLASLPKVIRPKYYKDLKKGAHQCHLGRQKMGHWQLKLKIWLKMASLTKKSSNLVSLNPSSKKYQIVTKCFYVLKYYWNKGLLQNCH